MVNERYEGEGQEEEGEYHFSDDQANYDMDAEASGKDSATVAVAPKESIADKIKQHRRIVIGLLVFIILLGIVYKLVAPSSTPVTDFQPEVDKGIAQPAQTAKAIMPPATPAPVVQAQPAAPVATQATTVTTTTQSVPQQPQQQPMMPAPTTTQPAATVPEQPAAPMQQPVAAPEQQATPPQAVTTTTVVTTPPADGVKNIPDRVATLEQQNAAMMNLMQTQYAQKIADTELQNTQLRTEVQELTARISNMEVAFRQLTKILQNTGATAAPNRAPAAPRAVQPKIAYTVQAIIPGRAWLKSESGDTVTVAEGDTLKGYGRIAKIDPYDGIVDIDTGNRIVSLSYGANGD